MNIRPGGAKTPMHDTIIPVDNLPPKPGRPDTRGLPQQMVYPLDFPDRELAGKAKGMKVVLQERVSMYDELVERVGGEKKVVGKCKSCRTSQAKKDALRRIASAEASGQEDTIADEDIEQADADLDESDQWCCIYRVLSLQHDFVNEKPLIQKYVESRGHVCLFYPKFHCELNPIEMVWGHGKYRFRLASDGKFTTAKELVPRCLDMADKLTIRRFFRKTWRYMDAYRKGLDARQAAFAIKKYKSHRRVGTLGEILAAIKAQEERQKR